MRSRSTGKIVATTGALLVSFALPLGFAAPAQAENESAAIHRDSVSCTKPAGNKVNYSWDNSGSASTTVYFNNHCSHHVRATLHYTKRGDNPEIIDCLNTNGGTKGRKKFAAEPLPGYKLTNISKGCPIP